MLVHSRMYVCAYYMLAQVCNYYVCHSMAMRDVQLFFQTEYAYGVHCAKYTQLSLFFNCRSIVYVCAYYLLAQVCNYGYVCCTIILLNWALCTAQSTTNYRSFYWSRLVSRTQHVIIIALLITCGNCMRKNFYVHTIWTRRYVITTSVTLWLCVLHCCSFKQSMYMRYALRKVHTIIAEFLIYRSRLVFRTQHVIINESIYEAKSQNNCIN